MRSARAGALAFLMAFVTLFVQVLLCRIISVKLLNSYAFLVISLTMLGFACSGILLTKLLPWFDKHRDDALLLSSAGFAVSFLAAVAVVYHVDGPYRIASRLDFQVSFLRWMPVALLLSVPFIFSGFALGGLLSIREFSARRIYFSD